MTAETDIKPGDTVRLKSGGPRMTVTQVAKTMYSDRLSAWCTWFESTKVQESVFVIDAVVKVAPAGSDTPQVRRINDLLGSRI